MRACGADDSRARSRRITEHARERHAGVGEFVFSSSAAR
jgi:hypothetical protein